VRPPPLQPHGTPWVHLFFCASTGSVVPTIRDTVADFQQRLAQAKADAAIAREDAQADPSNRRLRVAAELKTEQAAQCGRDLAFWQFEAEVEREFTRISEGDSVVPAVLMRMAPRVHGQIDCDWVAAAVLQRRGISAPPGWRSLVSGEPLNDSFGANQAGAARISA
jgi:hypothetical protein